MARNLFIGLSNIGDVVMTTAALQVLHNHAPAATVDVVGDPRSSELFAGCPYVGRILHKDKRGALRGLPRLVRELRHERYDTVVDLRTDFLPWLLRAQRRLLRWQAPPTGPHAVQRHLAVVAALGSGAGILPRLWLRDADVAAAGVALGAYAERRLLALGPGANWGPKTWPARGFAALVGRTRDVFDGVVLLGGPADRVHVAEIAASAAVPVVDLVGRTGLLEAAAVLARAVAFVGNDSGLGHMAAAVGTPTLTLFGPGDPHRYHPWGPRAAWLVEPSGDLARLDVAEVDAALRRLVAGRLSGGVIPGRK